MVFGPLHKPFSLARWQEARRFQGTTFRDWTITDTGTTLIDSTAMKWNSGNMTTDEIAIVMNRLRLMVPKKALQQYSTPNGDWNYTLLATTNFMDILNGLFNDEDHWKDLWEKDLPQPSRFNWSVYLVNSIQSNRDQNQRKDKNKNRPPPQESTQECQTLAISGRGRNNDTPRGNYNRGYQNRGGNNYRGRGANNRNNQTQYQNQPNTKTNP